VYTPARRVPRSRSTSARSKSHDDLLLEMKFSLSDEGHPHLRLASTWRSLEEIPRWCLQQNSPVECLGLLRGDLSQADASVRRQLALSSLGMECGMASPRRSVAWPTRSC